MISTAAPSPGDRGGPRDVVGSLPAPSKVAGGARPSSSVRRHRLPMRSSPYVGWFRHAPPSSLSSRRALGAWGGGVGRPRSHSFSGSGSSMGRYQNLRPPSFGGRCPSSPGRMKSSPYVGWFRHAPPSRVPRVTEKAKSKFGAGREAFFAEALEVLLRSSSKPGAPGGERHDATETFKTLPIFETAEIMARGGGHHRRYYVDGRLRGGCPLREEDGGCGGGGEGVFPFDDDDGDVAATRLFDAHHHRVFDSIHQSASTRGLHFNAFGQEDEEDDQEDDEERTSPIAPDKSSSDLLSSIGTDEDSFHGGGDGDGPPSSATVGVLNRLGHWFLSPLAHDLESPYEELARSSDAANALYGHVGPGATTALFPLFAGMLKRALLLEDGGEAADSEDASLSSEKKYPWEGDEGREDCQRRGRAPPSEVIDTQEASSREDAAPAASSRPLPDSSVSSLAEAYYAHQASREFLEAAERAGLSSSSPADGAAVAHRHHHPLDYVITQIDIARMVRNASRHLDVESILGLPTVTYRGGGGDKKAKKERDAETARAEGETGGDRREGNEGEPPLRRSAGRAAAAETPENGGDNDDDVAWSWMIVPLDPEGRSSREEAPSSPPRYELNDAPLPASYERQPPSSSLEDGRRSDDERVDRDDHSEDDERCVICLDHFQDGDVLRVLPCDHLFHATCVDRWLSGASSHEECFTAGCPTCKERPVVHALYGAASASGSPEGATGTSAAAGAEGPGAGALRCGEEEGLLAGSGDCSGEGLGANPPLDGSVPRWAFARLGDAMAGRA